MIRGHPVSATEYWYQPSLTFWLSSIERSRQYLLTRGLQIETLLQGSQSAKEFIAIDVALSDVTTSIEGGARMHDSMIV